MKLSAFAAALSCGLTLAHPRHAFPHAGGYNTTTSAAVLPYGSGTGSGVANCTSLHGNSTLWNATATAFNGSTSCGCTTALETTTVYVFEPEIAPSWSPFPPITTGSASTTTKNTYFYSVVNGTTAWQNNETPPPNAGTTYYYTSTVYPVVTSSVPVTITVTSQNTLTSTFVQSSSRRTETIVVTETIPTTTHVSYTGTGNTAVATSTIASTVINGGANSASVITLSTIVSEGSSAVVVSTVPQSSVPEIGSSIVASTLTQISASVVTSTNAFGQTIVITSTQTFTETATRSRSSASPSETEGTGIVISSSPATTGAVGNITVSPSSVEETVMFTSSRTLTAVGTASNGTIISSEVVETEVITSSNTFPPLTSRPTVPFSVTGELNATSVLPTSVEETITFTSSRTLTAIGTGANGTITSSEVVQTEIVTSSNTFPPLETRPTPPFSETADTTAGTIVITSSRTRTATGSRPTLSFTGIWNATTNGSSFAPVASTWLPPFVDSSIIPAVSTTNAPAPGNLSTTAVISITGTPTVGNFSSTTSFVITGTPANGNLSTIASVPTTGIPPLGGSNTSTPVGSPTSAPLNDSSSTASGSSEVISITGSQTRSTSSAYPSLQPSGTEGWTFTGFESGTPIGSAGTSVSTSSPTSIGTAGTGVSSTTPSSTGVAATGASSSSPFSTESTDTSVSPSLVISAAANTTTPCATTTEFEDGTTTVEHTLTITALSTPASSQLFSTLANPVLTSTASGFTSYGIIVNGTTAWSNTTKTPCTISGSHTHSSSAYEITIVHSWTTSVLSSSGNHSTTHRINSGILPPSITISHANVNSTLGNSVATQTSSGAASSSANATTTSQVYGQTPPPYPTAQPSNTTISNSTSACGETGNFTINWDDEPLYVQDSKDDPPYAPVFNPYHHLFFANGFSYYAPDHSLTHPATYDPVSGPNVAIYRVDPSASIDDRDELPADSNMLPGTVGAGPRANDRAYWFNAFGAALGCDNAGSAPCNMTITGYAYNLVTQKEDKVVTQYAEIAPCSQMEDCVLQPVELEGFYGLSSIGFEAVVDGATLKSFVVDNLNMEWFDNSCAAGQKRVSSKKK